VSEDAEINETGEERYRSTVMVQMLGISPQWLLNENPFVEEMNNGNSKLLIHLDLSGNSLPQFMCCFLEKKRGFTMKFGP